MVERGVATQRMSRDPERRLIGSGFLQIDHAEPRPTGCCLRASGQQTRAYGDPQSLATKDEMDGNPTPHPKRRAADPIAKLEKSGGAVWACRPGRGRLLELKYARRQGANAVLEGTIHTESLFPDGAVDAADAKRLSDLAVDDLRLIGWKPDASGIIKRTWVLRSDLDRSELRRTVDQSIALLARLHGAEPTAYRLVYRPPGEEDAGYAQVGCVFAVPSALIGTLIGGLVTVARGDALPLIEAAIFAAVVGFSLGFLVFGELAPRVLALVPATRAGAANTTMVLQLLIPGLISFATWLLLPVVGLQDGDQLLGISVVIAVAVVVLPVPGMLLAFWRTRRKD